MNLHTLLLTQNECYRYNKKITVKGICVHSTGANNPMLRRYVGPDDGLLGNNQYNNHWNQFRPDGRQVCVHAFIGKLANGSIATYQTLPWEIESWHGGSGVNGRINDTHIGFEICEDGLIDKNYFDAVYKEAVELTAYLCKKFNLDPTSNGTVICHAEGYKRGIATNHGDVNHWFPKFGKTMDMFRADVKKLTSTAPPVSESSPSSKTSVNPTLKIGDKVTVKNVTLDKFGSTYDGNKFKVYYQIYDVIRVSGDRIVIGIGDVVTAAVNIKNLIKL